MSCGGQATSAKHYGEKDARLEYLSWRVWFMKRKHALAKDEKEARQMAGLVEDATSRIHDEETSDDEPMLSATSTGSKGVSFHLPKREPSLQKVRAGPDMSKSRQMKTSKASCCHMQQPRLRRIVHVV